MKSSAKLKILPIILITSFAFSMVLSWAVIAVTHRVTMPNIHSMIMQKSIIAVDERPGIVVFIEAKDDGYIGHIFEQGTVFGSGFIELYRHRTIAYEDFYLTIAHGRQQRFGVSFTGARIQFAPGTPYPWYARRLAWLPFCITALIFVIVFRISSKYMKKRRM